MKGKKSSNIKPLSIIFLQLKLTKLYISYVNKSKIKKKIKGIIQIYKIHNPHPQLEDDFMNFSLFQYILNSGVFLFLSRILIFFSKIDSIN